LLTLSSAQLPWFAVRVRSNYEQIVSTALRGKGYEEFLPTYRVQRRWTDRVKEVELPLFPGYVFCRIDLQRRLPVVTIPGFINLVGAGRAPLPISEQEIHVVQAVMRSDLLAQPWPFLREGERVEIFRGSLAGTEGLLVRFKNQLRVVVSVTLLQRSVAVEVDGDWVRPIKRGPARATPPSAPVLRQSAPELPSSRSC
jgi:transcription antitermination factor NusG